MVDIQEKVVEIKTRLEEQVLPAVKELVARRDEAQTRLHHFESALEEHEKKELVMGLEVDALIDEIADLLGEGKDPSLKQAALRKVQDEIAETKATVLKLREAFMPEALKSLDMAKEALAKAVKEKIAPIRDEIEQRMAKIIDDGISWWPAWDEASDAFYKQFAVPLLAGTQDEIPHFHKHSELLDLYVRNAC
jgi:hypothetical protein